MEYLYYFENANLTLRLVDYLCNKPQMPVAFITLIHQMDAWIVKVKMNSPLNFQQDGDFRAYLNELGIPEEPSRRISMALMSLELGQSAIDIMRRYQVVVVFHDKPKLEEIQALQQILI